MELSKKDRQILINQFSILKIIDSDNAETYSNYEEILFYGYKILYPDIFGLYDEMPENEGNLVFDILSIYRLIEFYKRDHPDDEEITNHLWRHFEGFDGNNEGEYHGFTLFLIDKYNRFAELSEYKAMTDNFNSHAPMLDKYKNMIKRWEDLNKDLSTRENILAVLEA